jgi:outer membrane receptor protein involved in Fe transport
VRALHESHAAEMQRSFTGVILVNGVKAPTKDVTRLAPFGEIASVEIFKGAKALTMSNDPAAVNGVIIVTTKKAAAKKQ